MPRNSEPIREATSAEVSLARLVGRIWRYVLPALRAAAERALAAGQALDVSDVRRQLLAAIDSPSSRRAIHRAGARIVADLRAQVRALLPEDLVVPPSSGEELATLWEEELRRELIELLVGEGPTRGDARLDGRIRSLLERARAAAASPRATVTSVIEAAAEAVQVVKRRVISGARGLLGRANRAAQLAAGVKRYTWITRSDDRVRPGHRSLHGSIQDWSSPPITDPVSGRRAHPGEERNCRCVALPYV